MLRIFRDLFVPKYKSGKWIYDDYSDKFKFVTKEVGKPEPEFVIPRPFQIGDFKFKESIDQVEEIIMRKVFTRDHLSYDSDVITIFDIKNLVLFLAPSEIMTPKFIDFVFDKEVDKFLNALIIYFEYFLKIVEYLLIERDEMSDEVEVGRLQGNASVQVKQMLAEYLCQYRLLIAREYAKIVMGTHGLSNFHHITVGCNISKTVVDRNFHEAFIAFCTQIVWIAHHRRAYKVIDGEMNRLFRSCHFNLTKNGALAREYITYNKVEQQVLYGKNDIRCNFRQQNSPIIQEVLNISAKNQPILWIGEKKYRGTDIRILEMELEFVIPDSQLAMIDVAHGILGHPKSFYNTMLALDWTVIRSMNYSIDYDPYKLFRSPYIKIPNWDNFTKIQQHYKSYFELEDVRHEKDIIAKQKRIWRQRDRIVYKMKQAEQVNDILLECQKQIDALNETVHIQHENIVKKYLIEKQKLRKTRADK